MILEDHFPLAKWGNLNSIPSAKENLEHSHDNNFYLVTGWELRGS